MGDTLVRIGKTIDFWSDSCESSPPQGGPQQRLLWDCGKIAGRLPDIALLIVHQLEISI